MEATWLVADRIRKPTSTMQPTYDQPLGKAATVDRCSTKPLRAINAYDAVNTLPAKMSLWHTYQHWPSMTHAKG